MHSQPAPDPHDVRNALRAYTLAPGSAVPPRPRERVSSRARWPRAGLRAARGSGRIRVVALSTFIGIFVFLFGLIIGSFLNVCILRIPSGKSIVLPASACPKCGEAIRPYDNIPVLSYLLLGGKCRGCKTKISRDVSAGGVFDRLAISRLLLRVWAQPEALKWAAFSAIMVVLVFTDLRERILPDVVNFTGLGIGLISAVRQADGRHRAMDRESSVRLPSPGAGAFAGGCGFGRGSRRRLAVAGSEAYSDCAGAKAWDWAM